MADIATSSIGWDSALTSAGIVLVIGSVPLLLLGKYRDFSSSSPTTEPPNTKA